MRYVLFLFGVLIPGISLVGCDRPSDADITAATTRYLLESSPQIAAAERYDETGSLLFTDTVPDWLASGSSSALVAHSNGVSTGEAETGSPTSYVSWEKRRGPAYPGDFWHSLGRDAKELLPTLWDDTKATATNPPALILIGAAGAAGIVLSATDVDDHVADHYTRHGHQLSKGWDAVGDIGGNPGTHFGVAGAMYLISLYNNDTKNYEVSKTLINALALNGLTPLALKGIVRTRSPNGDPWGWPSGHTSSTFCLATVLHEAYGPWVGVPLFAFAGFVGYERIDARNHDFSDVISGALIGIAIGHAVSQNHKAKIFGMDVIPYVDPATGATGLALIKQW